jgi:DHA1 family inner membrane transport protein
VIPPSLASLVLAAFSIGTTEFVIAGLLPSISVDLAVSIPSAGLLVTGYAIGVAIGGPIMGLLLTPFQRKQSILLVMGIFILGHLWCAFAPNYALLMAGRIIISLSHGTFFGMAVIIAGSLVPPDRSGRAVGMIVAGITIANILGVPGGTAIGQVFGWRAVFIVLAVLGGLSAFAMAILLPSSTSDRSQAPKFSDQFRALANHQVYLTFAAIIFMMIGFWCVFTYVAPLLTTTSGIEAEYVPALLLLFGIGATIGAVIGGRLADQTPRQVLFWAYPAQAVVFGSLLFASGSGAAMAAILVVFGIVTFIPNATLVSRLLKGAAAAPELASTLMSTVFNIGIASGAYLGAVALERNVAYAQLPWFGIGMVAVAFGLTLISLGQDKRVGVEKLAVPG